MTPHPLRNFMDRLSLINTTFTEEGCTSILGDGDSTGIFPATRSWMGQHLPHGPAAAAGRGGSLDADVASRVAWWLVHHIPFCSTSDAGTPETLAPSLPFLDRIAVVSSICTALVVAISLGYQDPLPALSPQQEEDEEDEPAFMVGLGVVGGTGRRRGGGDTALALFGEGVERETYEWDSSFVERLMLQYPSTQRHYIEDVVRLTGMIALGHTASCTSSDGRGGEGPSTPAAMGVGGQPAREIQAVTSAKSLVESLLVSAMLGEGRGAPSPQDSVHPCIARAVNQALVDTMLHRHLRGLGRWFEAHMAAYGPVYSAYVR